MKIVFLTLENPEGFVIYDKLCIPSFENEGMKVEEVPWTKSVNWAQYDLVIIRSTWDYQQKWKKFIEVLQTIQNQTLLANSLDTVLWNVNKKYLLELEKQGFPIIKSYFFENELQEKEFNEIKSDCKTERLVIKPQVSANADNTFVITLYDDYQKVKQVFKHGYILQPYLQNIEKEGEISLFYFGNEYSHAVQKIPKAGDFRVQEEHGGNIIAYPSDKNLIQIGKNLVDYLNKKLGMLLYARVDIVREHQNWKIMEVELIEPSLYFPYCEQACNRFAIAVKKWLENINKFTG